MIRRFLLVAGLAAAAAAGTAVAQDIKFFRIGTGGTAGTYYPIGGLIANAISNPPGSRACNDGGSCGAPGVVATAVASNGSVANINGIQSGSLESGFTQSDVAYWAYTGTGVYEGKPKVADLRLIGNLYPETIHLVARKGAHRMTPRAIDHRLGDVRRPVSLAQQRADDVEFFARRLFDGDGQHVFLEALL